MCQELKCSQRLAFNRSGPDKCREFLQQDELEYTKKELGLCRQELVNLKRKAEADMEEAQLQIKKLKTINIELLLNFMFCVAPSVFTLLDHFPTNVH